MKTPAAKLGAGAVAAAAVLWGLWPYWVARAGSPATAAVALAVAGLLGLPLALRQGRGQRRGGRLWRLMGLLGVRDAANVGTYFHALGHGALAPAVISHYLAPVLVALAAPRLLGEAPARRGRLALVLALAGTITLVALGRGAGPAGGHAFAVGVGWGGASAVFYAAVILLSRRLGREFGDVELLSYHVLVSAVLLLPLGLPGRVAAGWAALGGLVSTLLAGVLYYSGLRRLGAERTAVLSYLEPVAALGVGWLAFGLAPTIGALVGGALVLGGGLVVVLSAREP